MKTDTVRFAVMRGLDKRLKGDALKAFVAEVLGRPAPVHTLPLANAIISARRAVSGKPCDGTKRSRAFHLLIGGASNETIARKLRTSVAAVTDWRVQLAWVSPAAAASTPRKKAKALIKWDKSGTAAPLRRKRKAIWEFVVDVLADGYHDLNEITVLVQENVDPEATRKSVESIYTAIVSAKLALEGFADDSAGNRVARAVLAWRGNKEAAIECQVPIAIVYGIRNALRRMDAARVPLDPTFHLQPAGGQNVAVVALRPGKAPPWAPPGPKKKQNKKPLPAAEGRPVGIKKAAEPEFLSGKANVEVLARLRKVFPRREIKPTVVRTLRNEARQKFGPERVPSEWDARRARGLAKPKKPASTRGQLAPFAKQSIREGALDAEVLEKVLKAFPEARTALASIRSYRARLRGAGEDIPTNKQLMSARRRAAA